jgi:uncharacterized protein
MNIPRSAPAVLLALCAACAPNDQAVPTDAAPGSPPAEPAAPATEPQSNGESSPAREDEAAVHTNRLAQESSPYLLQHQHNPVDWYPWGDEAFEKARREDKPIFLSIGYSTCHWCHVMERESFENEEVAKLLNDWFVSIKVDREERPDVDDVYMAAVQAMNGGGGGWPLSAFLTPDRKPFYGGTYFPPEDRYGRPGFKTVLARLHELWTDDRAKLLEGAEQIVTHLAQRMKAEPGQEIGADTLRLGVRQFEAGFDAEYGGFGTAPKFPRSFALSFLLGRAQRDGADTLLPAVESTLHHMRIGGIHDHLGGGFHRYSTDREWLVPHFEKMLYDQAYLAQAYLQGYLVTGKQEYADVARGIFDYVLRDLRDPAGGFHSAEDADSEGVEGKFYVWTVAEIHDVLGEADGALVASVYACTAEGNFVDEATRRRTGENILHLTRTIEEHAQERGEAPAALEARLAAARDKLLAVRSKRIRPHLDDKVVTDWNGMMISALALGGSVLGEDRYVAAANEAADFLLTTMRTKDGLLHRYRAGQAGITGYLDDYAFLSQGLLDLYQATFDAERLVAARDLLRKMIDLFADPENGGFHLTARGAEALILRPKDLYDGAIPSGNSAAANVLVRLGRITQDDGLEAAGGKTLRDWSGTIARRPEAFPRALTALDFVVGPSREIVIAGDPADEGTKALLSVVRERFLPFTVLVLNPPGERGDAIRALAPFIASQGAVDGKPAAYVCTAYACQAPVTSTEELARLLDE